MTPAPARPQRFSVKIGKRERLVELEEADKEGGGMRIVVDGASLALDVWQAEPGLWVLRAGSAQTVAQVDGEAPKLSVAIRRPGGDPIVVPVEVVDARSARAAAPAGAAGAAVVASAAASGALAVVRSTIPGRVVKLLVRAGDSVAAGQATVVLEAMKMENELRAPRAGTVKDVRCAEGATVEAGQDLVVIA